MSSMKVDTDGLKKGLEEFQKKADAGLILYAETAALTLESHAKQNAPWEDRSGRARQTLKGSVTKYPGGCRIVLAHGVDYGIWLELAHDKNYAILNPTINLKSHEILEGFNGLLDRIRTTGVKKGYL